MSIPTPKYPAYYLPCPRCDWAWRIHRWLPFDFHLARLAYRRHERTWHR